MRAAATVVAAALLVGGCGTRRDDVVALAAEAASVRQVDCPQELAGDGRACGLVTVPIDRADPAAGSTHVTIVMVPGSELDFPTPVAVLQGGPGGASTDMATWFPQQPFTQVFVDQRGTGFGGPSFDCMELDDVMARILASSSAEAEVLAQRAVDDCARRLDEDPVLVESHSGAHAADVVDVMASLGHERWVAYGVSYGSTIAMEILRDEPPGLAGVILDGVYPPDLDAEAGLAESAAAALRELSTACGADAICRGYVDGEPLVAVVDRVIGELDDDPFVVPVGPADSGLGQPVDVVLDGRRFAEFTFLLLYSEARLRFLPAVIGGIDRRDDASARWLAATGSRVYVSSQRANDEGTYFAVQCHDRLPFTDGAPDDLEPFPAAVTASSLEEGCMAWDRRAGGPEVADPVVSSVPALLLSGQFDPITPPAFAERVEGDLERSTSVVQQGRGHGIWYGDDCIAGIVQSFVADPARDLDTECAAAGVPVEWAHP